MKNNYWDELIEGYKKEKRSRILEEIYNWVVVILVSWLFALILTLVLYE